MHETLQRVMNNPWLNLTAGMALLVTSLWEVIESFDSAEVGAHHGLLLFALVHVLKVLPDVLEGARSVHESLDEVEKDT